MTQVTINRFHARYRLAAGAGAQQDRLRRVLARVVEDGLEAAIQRGGIDTSGELCIRAVNARARLNLDQTDSTLAAELGLAIVDAIDAEIERPGAQVVRYGSRAHALIDLTVAALAGDFTRAWAWRRLGIWEADAPVSTAAAVRLTLRALTAEPRHAVAALAYLARDPSLFDRLLEHLSAPRLAGLVAAVVAGLGADPNALFAAVDEPAGPAPTRAARRLARCSVVAGAAAASRRIDWAKDARCPLLAALAVCEVEPALLRASPPAARTHVRAVIELLVEQGRSGGARSAPRPPVGEVHDAVGEAPRPQPSRQSLPPADGDAGPAVPLPPASASPRLAGVKDRLRATEFPPGEAALPEVGRRGHTRFGGLLYLVNLMQRLQLAKRMVEEPALAERSPRWCLHQLALTLIALAPTDPAVLAFAGLLPGSEPPSARQPEATGPELAAITALRSELIDSLRGLLDRRVDPEPVLIELVCRRTAEIVADPGWMEVRFSLDDVCTEIRARGLDLDPGWVPWLGLVVKFVYG